MIKTSRIQGFTNLNVDISEKIAIKNKAQPRRCWANAAFSVAIDDVLYLRLKEYRDFQLFYVEGWVFSTLLGFPIDHGWVELVKIGPDFEGHNHVIIDPTLVMLPNREQEKLMYFPLFTASRDVFIQDVARKSMRPTWLESFDEAWITLYDSDDILPLANIGEYFSSTEEYIDAMKVVTLGAEAVLNAKS